MMEIEDKVDILMEQLRNAVSILNSNYIILQKANKNLTKDFCYYISLYRKNNYWEEKNLEIRYNLLREVYKIQKDLFLTDELAEKYLLQLFEDLEGDYQLVNLDMIDRLGIGYFREYPSLLGYINKYVKFNSEEDIFELPEDLEEELTKFYK